DDRNVVRRLVFTSAPRQIMPAGGGRLGRQHRDRNPVGGEQAQRLLGPAGLDQVTTKACQGFGQRPRARGQVINQEDPHDWKHGAYPGSWELLRIALVISSQPCSITSASAFATSTVHWRSTGRPWPRSDTSL